MEVVYLKIKSEIKNSILALGDETPHRMLEGEKNLKDAMPECGYKTAMQYFLNHYKGPVVCTENIAVPLDNNSSERAIRGTVIGRKTWYGTQSKRGALTNAIRRHYQNAAR